MALIEKLKSMVGGEEEEQTYSYTCSDCGTGFESTAVNPNDAECPECGSRRVHSVT